MGSRSGWVLIIPDEMERILQDLTMNHGLIIGVQEKNDYARTEFCHGFCDIHRLAFHFSLSFTWPESKLWDFDDVSEPMLVLTNPRNCEGWFTDLQFGIGFDKSMPAEAIERRWQLFRLFDSKLRRLGLSRIPLWHSLSGAEILRPPKVSPGALKVFQAGGKFAMQAWGDLPARVFYVADGVE